MQKLRTTLLVLSALAVATPAFAQTKGGAAPDFTSIPKMEPMKDKPSAPDFTLATPDGKKKSLKDYRGKVVFLNFWATWCPSCRTEMPDMQKLYSEYKGKGFEIVAVNVKDKKDDAMKYVSNMKLTYPILLDPEGEAGLLYGAWGMPATYLIDRKGVVQARLWGPAEWNSPQARKLIAAMVEQK
jgi:DsbE subfamily thiol:disulfide oxidoreductase